MIEPHFPEDGILWRTWSEETLQAIAEKDRPVLLLVADPEPTVWPFVRGFLQAAPRNARLRTLLNDEFIALYVTADNLPEDLSMYGAGSRYHLAVLSPSGFNPLATIALWSQGPLETIDTVVKVLEGLLGVWQP